MPFGTVAVYFRAIFFDQLYGGSVGIVSRSAGEYALDVFDHARHVLFGELIGVAVCGAISNVG
jgi:hypothetical protein